MRASQASAAFAPRAEPQSRRRRRLPVGPLWRLGPNREWATFAFILATLLVVGQSVSCPNWVETLRGVETGCFRWVEMPGLFSTLILSTICGLLLAKVRLPAVLLHPLGLLVGAAAIIFYTASLMEDQSGYGEYGELWERLSLWWDAAAGGGISTDLAPFSMIVLAIAWLLGYISSWFIFRSGNVWVAVVLLGTAILTILSFLPKSLGHWFFIFTFFTMVLVVHVRFVQLHRIWQRAGRAFNPAGGWHTLHATAWLSLVVILFAAFLPLVTYKHRGAADSWNRARAPVEIIQDEFARLFAGIPSKKDLSGRFFGKTLPFLGKVSFGGEAVFWTDTEHPAYWLSSTYSEYTSKGWKAGETEPLDVGPDLPPPPREDSLGRVRSEQSLQLTFDTSAFLAGGALDWISEDAVVHTLRPKRFTIDLEDASEDVELPDDISQLASQLRDGFNPSPTIRPEAYAAQLIPKDLRLVAVTRDRRDPDGELRGLVLERKGPPSPDVVSHKFAQRLISDQAYAMVSYVSIVDDEELKTASTDYGSFITDHYLQLPNSLPQRVRDLAERVSADAETPMDKALAVQDHLRGSEFTYSREIDRPPRGSDGVDHFLFESKEGYSDYFASSMAVLLRAVGVPARLAAGYGPGEVNPDSAIRTVRDTDSHGWVQVYFPGYGWIDFEPTPAFPVHSRVPGAQEEASGESGLDLSPDVEGNAEFIFDLEEDELDEEGILTGPFVPQEGRDWTGVGIRAAITLGVLGLLGLMATAIWNLGLSNISPVEQAYLKMSRLSRLAGLRRRVHQTPVEYAETIASELPAVAGPAQRIGWALATTRYSSRQEPGEESGQIDEAWKELRGSLLLRALSRLIPSGSGQRR